MKAGITHIVCAFAFAAAVAACGVENDTADTTVESAGTSSEQLMNTGWGPLLNCDGLTDYECCVGVCETLHDDDIKRLAACVADC